MDIYNYTDYRKFLSDWLAAAKAGPEKLTYRSIAGKVGFKSPGHLTMILSGDANISPALAARFAGFLGLKKHETGYFVAMVKFNQAKRHSDKKQFFEELAASGKSRIRTVDAQQYAFYDKWYHSAIRVALDYFPFSDDYKALGKLLIPAITPAKARKSIELLRRLGLIEQNSEGYWKPTDLFLTTGYEAESVALNNFVLNSMELAAQAIERFPKAQRNMSALTIGISRAGFETIQEEIRAFRRKILDIVKNEKAETVYQMSMQFFPLANTPVGERGTV